MATTIENLTYRVWRILEGGDIPDDSRFRYGEIRDHVRSAVAYFMKASLFETLQADEYRYGDSSVTFVEEQTVGKDATGAYITLTGQQISSPVTSRLLHITDVNPFDRNSVRYVPVRPEERFLSQFQEPVPGVVLFERNGNEVRFFNRPVSCGTKVKVYRTYAIPEDD